MAHITTLWHKLTTPVLVLCLIVVLTPDFIPGLDLITKFNKPWQVSVYVLGFFAFLVLKQLIFEHKKQGLTFLSIIGVIFVSALVSDYYNIGEIRPSELIPAIVCFSAFYLARNKGQDPLVIIVSIAFFVSSLVDILGFSSLSFLKVAKTLNGTFVTIESSGNRWSGVFGSPNILGICAVYLILKFYPYPVKNPQKLAWFGTIVTFIFLVSSMSRGALLAFVLSIIWLDSKNNIKINKGLKFVMLPIILGAIMITFSYVLFDSAYEDSSVLQRISNLGQDFELRKVLFLSTVSLLNIKPFLGFGPGNYNLVGQTSVGLDLGAHVWLLELAFIRGWVHAIFVMALIAFLIYSLKKQSALKTDRYSGIIIALTFYSFTGGLGGYLFPWVLSGFSFGVIEELKRSAT